MDWGLQADSMVYQTEKQLKEFEGKVPDDVKTKVEEKVTALREALKGEDLSAVKVPLPPPFRFIDAHIHTCM